MSPAQALLNRLAELGAVVEVADNGRLVIRAVLTTISKEIVASARVLKAEIIEPKNGSWPFGFFRESRIMGA